MAGPFSIITGALGESDPEQDIGKWSDENQKRNRLALGLDENGNPLPAGASAPASAPGAPTALPGANPASGPSADVQGAAAAQAASTLPPNQEPNATKTPVSLGHLMMNLQQYNERQQGFDQALGQGFAAFAQPRDRQMVSQMFNTTPMDPMKAAQTQMSLGQQQQGQDRANMITQIINGPGGQAIADQLHMDLGVLRNMVLSDPGAAGKIAQQLGTPTDKMRDLTQIGHMGGGPGGPGGPGVGSTTGDIRAGIVGTIAGPENAPMDQAQAAWRADPKNAGKPDSAMPWHANDLTSYKQWQTNEASKEEDRGKASAILSSADNTMRELQGHIANLQYNPGLTSILNGSQALKTAAKNALNDPDGGWANTARIAGVLKEPEIAAINELRLVNSGQYASALQSMRGIASRPAAAEVQGVADAMGQTKGIDMNSNTYIKQAIEPLLTKIKYARANAYGAAGTFNGMDDDLKPYVHANYLPNGDLYKEGSGADEIQKTTNQPLPDDARAEAIARMKSDYSEKERTIDALRQRGFNVSELERMTPDKLRGM